MTKERFHGARRRGSRMNWLDYAKVIRRVVTRDSTTWADVQTIVKCTRHRAQVLIRGLHKQGLVHIADWVIPAGKNGCSITPSFRFGAGEDKPQPPINVRSDRKPLARTPVAIITICECVKAVVDGEYHGKSLAAYVGIYVQTARNVIQALRAVKLVHISGYQDRGAYGAGHAYYTWGPGKPDLKKPDPVSVKELSARWAKARSEKSAALRQMHAIVNARPIDKRRLVAAEAPGREAA